MLCEKRFSFDCICPCRPLFSPNFGVDFLCYAVTHKSFKFCAPTVVCGSSVPAHSSTYPARNLHEINPLTLYRATEIHLIPLTERRDCYYLCTLQHKPTISQLVEPRQPASNLHNLAWIRTRSRTKHESTCMTLHRNIFHEQAYFIPERRPFFGGCVKVRVERVVSVVGGDKNPLKSLTTWPGLEPGVELFYAYGCRSVQSNLFLRKFVLLYNISPRSLHI